MQSEDLEMLADLDRSQPRARLLALIARLTEADAAALWALLCSWYKGDTDGPR